MTKATILITLLLLTACKPVEEYRSEKQGVHKKRTYLTVEQIGEYEMCAEIQARIEDGYEVVVRWPEKERK